MHSIEFIEKVKQLYLVLNNYRKVAYLLKIAPMTIWNMVKTNYNRTKKKIWGMTLSDGTIYVDKLESQFR